MTKSTSSISGYCRIGTQPPGSNTSGARPALACGACCGSADMNVALLGGDHPAVIALRRLPRVAAIGLQPDITARCSRAAKAHRTPCGRVRVIGRDDVGNQPPAPEQRCRQTGPCRRLHITLFDSAQYLVRLVAV